MSWKLGVAVLLAALGLLLAEAGRLVPVRSAGMAPTLLPGDWIYVYTRGREAWQPERGELAAFALAVEGLRRHPPDRAPQLPTEASLGRVIGLPGDRVEVRREILRLDGERVRQVRVAGEPVPGGRDTVFHERTLGARRFVVAGNPGKPGPDLPETTVEPDRLLLLGDYRSQAYDGRYWGTLHRDHLLGRPLLVIFSRTPDGTIRWSRMGHWLDQ